MDGESVGGPVASCTSRGDDRGAEAAAHSRVTLTDDYGPTV